MTAKSISASFEESDYKKILVAAAQEGLSASKYLKTLALLQIKQPRELIYKEFKSINNYPNGYQLRFETKLTDGTPVIAAYAIFNFLDWKEEDKTFLKAMGFDRPNTHPELKYFLKICTGKVFYGDIIAAKSFWNIDPCTFRKVQ